MSAADRRRPPAAVVLAAAFAAGSVPFSNLVARRVRKVDLRTVGSGTVSGTSLYRVAGFGPLVVGGVADVVKGSVGPLLAGPDRPGLAAASAGVGVAAHNWSPLLSGAGGRGISPALGALLVRNWPGTALLLGGLTAGRLGGETAIGSLLADVALVPVLAVTRRRPGLLAGAAVLAPMLVKRLAGNGPPARRDARTYLNRLVLDRDTVAAA